MSADDPQAMSADDPQAMSADDPQATRDAILERWERGAAGWGKRAGRVRDVGMPVSKWMIESLELTPGQRVLELAAGPGDTGFMAAEVIAPTGTLISSDASEAMLKVARARAAELGVANVEFNRLELEWIDLPTATVDAALCRWGFMFCVDPVAAMREVRRVLRPGGRLAMAVWDDASLNPWGTIPARALVSLGHVPAPDPDAPGMFVLAPAANVREKLEEAGFVEVVVDEVKVDRGNPDLDSFLKETLDLSQPFADVWARLSAQQRADVVAEIERSAAPFATADGALAFGGRSIVALAHA